MDRYIQKGLTSMGFFFESRFNYMLSFNLHISVAWIITFAIKWEKQSMFNNLKPIDGRVKIIGLKVAVWGPTTKSSSMHFSKIWYCPDLTCSDIDRVFVNDTALIQQVHIFPVSLYFCLNHACIKSSFDLRWR